MQIDGESGDTCNYADNRGPGSSQNGSANTLMTLLQIIERKISLLLRYIILTLSTEIWGNINA